MTPVRTRPTDDVIAEGVPIGRDLCRPRVACCLSRYHCSTYQLWRQTSASVDSVFIAGDFWQHELFSSIIPGGNSVGESVKLSLPPLQTCPAATREMTEATFRPREETAVLGARDVWLFRSYQEHDCQTLAGRNRTPKSGRRRFSRQTNRTCQSCNSAVPTMDETRGRALDGTACRFLYTPVLQSPRGSPDEAPAISDLDSLADSDSAGAILSAVSQLDVWELLPLRAIVQCLLHRGG